MSRYKSGEFFSHEFVGESSWNGYEYNCLFANQGESRFIDVGRATASDIQPDSRGVAQADLDGDGRMDLVIASNDGPPTVLMNRVAPGRQWVALDLVGTTANRDAVGARVRLTVGGTTMTRWVEAGSGYASQSPHALHFGLGEATRIDRLEIDWPGGGRTVLSGAQLDLHVPVSARTRLVEGGAPPRTSVPAAGATGGG